MNGHSCIEFGYVKLFVAAKIHVQIMRFTCCLNMVFNLTKSKLICLHDNTRESVATLTDHFANAFVRQQNCVCLWHCGDVMTFKSLTLTPFCLEKSSVRKGIFK